MILLALKCEYLSNPVSSQHEVIVMDPDEGWLSANAVSGLHELRECLYCAVGKLLIGNSVRIPVLTLKGCPVRHRMEERPKRCVAAAIVVRIEYLWVYLNRDHLERQFLGYLAVRSRVVSATQNIYARNNIFLLLTRNIAPISRRVGNPVPKKTHCLCSNRD